MLFGSLLLSLLDIVMSLVIRGGAPLLDPSLPETHHAHLAQSSPASSSPASPCIAAAGRGRARHRRPAGRGRHADTRASPHRRVRRRGRRRPLRAARAGAARRRRSSRSRAAGPSSSPRRLTTILLVAILLVLLALSSAVDPLPEMSATRRPRASSYVCSPHRHRGRLPSAMLADLGLCAIFGERAPD